MSEKPTARLEQWEYHKDPDPFYGRVNVLTGNVYGHPNYPMITPGESITTSLVVGTQGDLVETQNTLYRLGEWSGRGPDKDDLLWWLAEVFA